MKELKYQMRMMPVELNVPEVEAYTQLYDHQCNPMLPGLWPAVPFCLEALTVLLRRSSLP